MSTAITCVYKSMPRPWEQPLRGQVHMIEGEYFERVAVFGLGANNLVACAMMRTSLPLDTLVYPFQAHPIATQSPMSAIPGISRGNKTCRRTKKKHFIFTVTLSLRGKNCRDKKLVQSFEVPCSNKYLVWHYCLFVPGQNICIPPYLSLYCIYCSK